MRAVVVAMVLVGGACAAPAAKPTAAPAEQTSGDASVRPPRVPVATVSLGQPQVAGDLDQAIIRRYIRRNLQKLQDCYEKQLLVTPGLEGTVTVDFTIGTNGTVTSSAAVGFIGNDVMQTCVTDLIKAIEFPKPGTRPVSVTYPFNFGRL